MRVLHVIPTLDPRAGGPAVALSGMAQAQAQAGLDVTVIATFRPGDEPAAEPLRAAGVKVQLIGPSRGSLMRHADLAATIENAVGAVDVVHVHALWEEIQYQAARVAHRRHVPYVITPHGMLDPWSLAQSRLKKRVYRIWRLNKMLAGAAALHYMTQVEREHVEADGGAMPPGIVEPVGIGLEEFANLPDKGEIRERYPKIGDRPLLVFLGRIHPGKGLEHLVPALAKVAGCEPVLLVVGPDSKGFRSVIETRIQAANLQERVIFTGMLKGADRVVALAGADLFCLPSDHENFGIAVIEALAAGVPVIVSDQVAVYKEVVSAGVGAVAGRQPDALAAEISQWLGNSELRNSAAARCRPFVRERYDWNNIARRWVEHYRKLLQ